MIKVIVCDMDGTVLNSKQVITKHTQAAIKRAQSQGIRFMIATGRKYKDVLFAIEDQSLFSDFIAISGAEVRNQKGELLHHIPMSYEQVEFIYQCVQPYGMSVSYHSVNHDYMIGTLEAVEGGLLEQARLFFGISDEEITTNPTFQQIVKDTIPIENVEYLREQEVPIYKVFIFSPDQEALDLVEAKISTKQSLACASSFANNVEITDVLAQKGLVLKQYIEELGYTMEEVMVLGDSMNDYSMLSMDFGATVIMENAMEPLKQVAKYMTKSNDEDGVAYAIEQVLEGSLDKLKIIGDD